MDAQVPAKFEYFLLGELERKSKWFLLAASLS